MIQGSLNKARMHGQSSTGTPSQEESGTLLPLGAALGLFFQEAAALLQAFKDQRLRTSDPQAPTPDESSRQTEINTLLHDCKVAELKAKKAEFDLRSAEHEAKRKGIQSGSFRSQEQTSQGRKPTPRGPTMAHPQAAHNKVSKPADSAFNGIKGVDKLKELQKETPSTAVTPPTPPAPADSSKPQGDS